MKKNILACCVLLLIIFISGCFVSADTETVYRRQITMESNLSKFQIGNTFFGLETTIFDSTSVYPYVLEDITTTSLHGATVIIYPVQENWIYKI